tara:strand:- start:533 stop:1039 length:507 start_codon:yes stop_codon:yes gene_type:complete
MRYSGDIKKAFAQVFSNKGYITLGLLFALIVLSLNVLLINYRLILNSFSFPLLWHLLYGGLLIMPLFASISLILISVLSGILVPLLVFQIRKQVALSSGVGAFGILFGVVAPACPSCAIGLLPLLGLGGLFAFLPFGGKEVSIFTIFLLVVAIIYISKKINTNTCSVD